MPRLNSINDYITMKRNSIKSFEFKQYNDIPISMQKNNPGYVFLDIIQDIKMQIEQ